MTKEQLQNIKKRVVSANQCADRIMDGGDNYDGADGAREVQDLCELANQLIAELETTIKSEPLLRDAEPRHPTDGSR